MFTDSIKVVNLKYTPYTLYIGRPNVWLNLDGSKWANPFHLKRESDRVEILIKHWDYLLNNDDLINSLSELATQTLGCYCKPGKYCHGDNLKAAFQLIVVEGRSVEECKNINIIEYVNAHINLGYDE
jgi:hypothetical protein